MTTPEQAAIHAAAIKTGGAAPNLEGPDTEKEIWQGYPSWKGFVLEFLGMLIWLALVSAAVGMFGLYDTSVKIAIAVVLLLAGWGFLGFRVISGRYSYGYRLTTQRLHLAKGLFARTYDQTDLLRVEDVSFTQGLFQRIMGVGDVKVVSPSDKSDPNTILGNVDNPSDVAEKINTARMNRRRKGATIVEAI